MDGVAKIVACICHQSSKSPNRFFSPFFLFTCTENSVNFKCNSCFIYAVDRVRASERHIWESKKRLCSKVWAYQKNIYIVCLKIIMKRYLCVSPVWSIFVYSLFWFVMLFPIGQHVFKVPVSIPVIVSWHQNWTHVNTQKQTQLAFFLFFFFYKKNTHTQKKMAEIVFTRMIAIRLEFIPTKYCNRVKERQNGLQALAGYNVHRHILTFLYGVWWCFWKVNYYFYFLFYTDVFCR